MLGGSAFAPSCRTRKWLARALCFGVFLVLGLLAWNFQLVLLLMRPLPPQPSKWLPRLLFADFPAKFEELDFNFRPCSTLSLDYGSSSKRVGREGSGKGIDSSQHSERHRVDSFPGATGPFAKVLVGNYASFSPDTHGEGLHAYHAYLTTADLVVRDERCCDATQRSRQGCDSSPEYPRVPGCPREAEAARMRGGSRSEVETLPSALQGYFLTIQYFCDMQSPMKFSGVFGSTCSLGDLGATVKIPSGPASGGDGRHRGLGGGEDASSGAGTSRDTDVFHLYTIKQMGVHTLVLRITPEEAREQQLKVEFRGKLNSDIRFDVDFCRVQRESAHTHGVSYCGSPLYGRKVNLQRFREFVWWHRRAGISSFHFYDRDPNVTELHAAVESIREEEVGRDSSSSGGVGSSPEFEITYTVTEAPYPNLAKALHHSPDGIQTYALNHCILNARHNSRWIWAADLDEYLFPVQAEEGIIDTCGKPGFFVETLEAHRTRNRNLYSVVVSGTTYTNNQQEGGLLEDADISSYITQAAFRAPKLKKESEGSGSRKSATRSDLAEQVWVHNSYGCFNFESWETAYARRFFFLLPPLGFKTECINNLPLGFAHFKPNEYMNVFSYHGTEAGPKRIDTHDEGLATLRDRLSGRKGTSGCGADDGEQAQRGLE